MRSFRIRKRGLQAAWASVVLSAVTGMAFAQVAPRSVLDVPGKEYTDAPNRDASGHSDPTRELQWNGVGGTANGYKFLNSGQVDALANLNDRFTRETAENQAALIFSVEGDDPKGVAFYEMPRFGGRGVWATAAQLNSIGVSDLNSLELWGPDGVSDADRFSLAGDINIAVFSRTFGDAVPWLSDTELASAIGTPSLPIDVDALMTDGDFVLFSIQPTGPFDGGEIWTYQRGSGHADFLVHAGHVWDTAFDVRSYFGLRNENIDALEAVDVVPEPSAGVVFALLGSGLVFRRRRPQPKMD